MPVMGGAEMMQHVKNLRSEGSVAEETTFIMCTAQSEVEGYREKGFEYVCKFIRLK